MYFSLNLSYAHNTFKQGVGGFYSWGQYFLKFILSNEDVTRVIHGISKSHHMIDNMGAGLGKLPDKAIREKMVSHLKSL